jgi:hypothetical protein
MVTGEVDPIRVEVHEPFLSEDGTVSAAVTLPETTDRLTARIPRLTVSDADENWTRGFVMSRTVADAYSAVRSADAALSGELEQWFAAHKESLPQEGFGFVPSDRKAGKVHFIVFRSPENWSEYETGDDCDVELELRGVQRSASARAYSALWRATRVERITGIEDVDDIDDIAKEMHHLAEKLSKGKADRAPIAMPS